MDNLQPKAEAISTAENNGHVIKQERSHELEELITYLVNYLKPRVLSDLQEKVLRGAWSGQTYVKIAEKTFNDPDYLKGIGANLWKILSEALSENVTKRNIKLVVKRKHQKLLDINQKTHHEEINLPKVTKSALKTATLGNESVTNSYRDWGDAPDSSLFHGRTQELATLERWLIGDCDRNYRRSRVLALLGIGGIGKTALAAKLARQVAPKFDIVIWKSLRNAPNFKNFLSELIFTSGDRQMFCISDTAEGQINNLMDYLRRNRCLLIFDHLDNILASGKLGGQYLDGYQGYGQLLRRIQDESHQSSVIITSREKPTGLSLREGRKSLVRSHVVKGLAKDAMLKILDDRGLTGSESTLQQFCDRCEGNPLILKMATATIEALFAGDLHKFISHNNNLLYGGIWQLLDQQFQRLSGLEQQLTYYLALENKDASFTQLADNIGGKIPYCQIIEALESLQGRSLIEITATGFIQQPIMLEYLKKKLLSN
ncbi:NB-ARC domain-containing protein [Xenococcus sp. PCC 7305]|uniref:NB-ARC domain-containing protein n=1 Tax=Xenococcus sp. PCC 7305 TaxID=102125 RepID=UPI0002ABCF76|nr:NB-ARC domain-containing protein [Xenococcus sp. PCC 7305]ELS00635.1 NB-ARC domain-containing protein [Xenococcus sp. PCC 7305]